ncbi:MAG TPA: LamG-like jellyroll fold domain-containing protein [Acidobacteriaceae bacterium]|nr:LamG-like jellyroll fold domain-containing protein [Acidobacteriaceae bacterium]
MIRGSLSSVTVIAALSLSLGAASFVGAQPPAQPAMPPLTGQPLPLPRQQTWRFDNLSSLGGQPTKVLGTPQLIDTPMGKAVAFNGTDSALFVGVHPLAGATTWTWEMIFRPDADGHPEQRIFHLQSVDPATGKDIPNERMLFEIRIRPDADGKPEWCLDSFATAGGHSRALLNCDKKYPFGPWYRVTAVYDGHIFRNYVGDELQGEGPLEIPAERPGRASAGTRIDMRDYFKGAIYEARFTPRALTPDEFLKIPAAGK